MARYLYFLDVQRQEINDSINSIPVPLTNESNALPIPSKPKLPSFYSKPYCSIVIGMAGSGKTSLMQRIISHATLKGETPYVINLDPAVANIPYSANIDIRKTVDYKGVMKEYQLGPNGGIMTSMNLFATRFNQVLSFVEKRAISGDLKHLFIDTPGQMEVFTWSASGSIITETLSSMLPTCLIYVIDTPRTTSPTTFMSNMMYACSIMYKFEIPMILAFNKVDICSHAFAVDWMKDFEVFQEAMDKSSTRDTYMNSLVRSMSMVLDEFYSGLTTVGVSATTGQGMDDLFQAIEEAAEIFENEYRPLIKEKFDNLMAKEEEERKKSLDQLRKDIEIDSNERKKRDKGKEKYDEEDDDEEDDEEEKKEVEKVMAWIKETEEKEKKKMKEEKEEKKKKVEEKGNKSI